MGSGGGFDYQHLLNSAQLATGARVPIWWQSTIDAQSARISELEERIKALEERQAPRTLLVLPPWMGEPSGRRIHAWETLMFTIRERGV